MNIVIIEWLDALFFIFFTNKWQTLYFLKKLDIHSNKGNILI